MRGFYTVFAIASSLFVICATTVWLTGSSKHPSDNFEELVENPLLTRDHSQRVDRLELIDTADAFRAGKVEHAQLTNEKPTRVVLAQVDDVGFPRRASWTSSETITDFPFTELVPTWNVITPKDTGVFFQVRIRDAASGDWSPWLFVGRWGRTVHGRSYDHLPSGTTTRFKYGAVRSDMPLVLLRHPADAFQIRGILQSFDLNPDVNPSIRRIAIAYSGMIKDPVERGRLQVKDELRSENAVDLDVPHVSQYDASQPLRESVCMPASVTMVLTYFKVDRSLTENALAIYDPDSGMFGNGARAIAWAGEQGLDGWMQRVRDWDEAKTLIGRGKPIIAAVKFEQAEHLIVIRGFTPKGEVIVNDPGNRKDGGTIWKADELGRAWFGSGGIACVIGRPAAD